jgi:hypothetical protein
MILLKPSPIMAVLFLMGKRVLIFGLFISVAVMGCVGAPDNVESDSSSADAKLGGGSLHVDSFKATGTTGSAASRFSKTDTPKNSFSSSKTADSLNKKKQ